MFNVILNTYKNKPEKTAFSVQLKTVFYKRHSIKGFFALNKCIDKLVCVVLKLNAKNKVTESRKHAVLAESQI